MFSTTEESAHIEKISDYVDPKEVIDADGVAVRSSWHGSEGECEAHEFAEALNAAYRKGALSAPPAGDDARDAARYRWLRGATWLVLKTERIKWVRPDGSEFYSSHFLQANGMQCAAAPTLDETIDAAMRAQGESK
jgi:hypothetical protein